MGQVHLLLPSLGKGVRWEFEEFLFTILLGGKKPIGVGVVHPKKIKNDLMGRIKICFLWWLVCVVGIPAFAQRGMPPKQRTSTLSHTTFAMHMDFLPDMVELLKVPDGWEVEVAASILGKPRMLYPGPDGSLYVTRRDGGDVLLLKDRDGDHRFDDVVTVVSDFKTVHGITSRDRYLYLCSNKELRRYAMNADGTVGDAEVLINDLPNGGQHPNRTIDFGPDGMLYISVGTECNDCKEGDKELATMLQVDPKTWERKIYASGLRNTIGFDWHPATGEFWGLDNGADAKGDNWPPEEVNRIVQDGNYGFPFAYGDREIDKTREDPAGDDKENWVQNTEPSMYELRAHTAPIAFQFFPAGANVPSEYHGDGLVCLHGSWNKRMPVGFNVTRIRFDNGVPVDHEVFLSGFLKPGFLMFKRKARFGRPAGLAIMPDGVIYVSDDANGVIYAIQPEAL